MFICIKSELGSTGLMEFYIIDTTDLVVEKYTASSIIDLLNKGFVIKDCSLNVRSGAQFLHYNFSNCNRSVVINKPSEYLVWRNERGVNTINFSIYSYITNTYITLSVPEVPKKYPTFNIGAYYEKTESKCVELFHIEVTVLDKHYYGNDREAVLVNDFVHLRRGKSTNLECIYSGGEFKESRNSTLPFELIKDGNSIRVKLFGKKDILI